MRMGKMEKQVKERLHNSRLQRAVLAAAESLAEMTTQMLAGSVYKMYKMMDRAEQKRKYRSILSARERLVKNGLLRWNKRFLELTPKGKERLREWEYYDYKIPRPKKWSTQSVKS